MKKTLDVPDIEGVRRWVEEVGIRKDKGNGVGEVLICIDMCSIKELRKINDVIKKQRYKINKRQ